MASEDNARRFFAATSLAVTFGLILQLGLSVSAESGAGSFESTPARIVNFFSFFTVQSNIVVAVATGMLAVDVRRSSTTFRTLRLTGVLAIMVTGVVFHMALADLQELTGWDALADFLLHTLSPILAPVGWLVFGPRGRVSGHIVKLVVVGPVLWLVYALGRGALVEDRFGNDYYPYPFMNAAVKGYGPALLNCVLVALLFLGLAFGCRALDRRLGGVDGDPDRPRPRRVSR